MPRLRRRGRGRGAASWSGAAGPPRERRRPAATRNEAARFRRRARKRTYRVEVRCCAPGPSRVVSGQSGLSATVGGAVEAEKVTVEGVVVVVV